ncbi:hypothetical protein LOTGIDRAFT_227345 [Lottia gigantea]|uniref:ADP-ribosylation factor n=1 Tax=Lottia gigantea TaxID=225164 RepID=V3ZTB3_LOTGI|nr:hypothetical protein LOTGIDRAFT_227345 [Lottia gigantea]ESO94688.1 hypothetical protein LOTGIDRAFT_227345 [Lottia gigantea]
MGQFMCKLWKAKEVRILMMGLDAAGKTTILYTLKLGEVVTTIPTIGFNVETIQEKKLGLTFTAWDVGGRDKIRPLMRHYFPNTDALLYIVDSTDDERLDDALSELCQCLNEDELRDSIFMLLCNKQDKPNAMTAEDIHKKFSEKCGTKKDIGVFPVSGINRETLMEPLKWLSERLASRQTWNVTKSSVTEAKDIVKPVTNPVGYFKQSWFYFTSLFQATEN